MVHRGIIMSVAGFLFAVGPCQSAQLKIDFGSYPQGKEPPGFASRVSGEGEPGGWKIEMKVVPPLLPPITPQAANETSKKVLVQEGGQLIDEHFPLLIYEEETFGDFKLQTRFKIEGGIMEQMAGIAFRVQDARNYYVIRASAKGNTFYFYKFVDGLRSQPIGQNIEIQKGEWYELSIECKGNQISLRLNGKEVIPTLTDYTFLKGKIGFWTKSDAKSCFADTQIEYTPVVPLIQRVIHQTMNKFDRLVGIQVYARRPGNAQLEIVASSKASEIGQQAKDKEARVIDEEAMLYKKEGGVVKVTLPLDDRNGEPVAAVTVVMDSFPGQTQNNAVARALPIVREIHQRLRTVDQFIY